MVIPHGHLLGLPVSLDISPGPVNLVVQHLHHRQKDSSEDFTAGLFMGELVKINYPDFAAISSSIAVVRDLGLSMG
jgi:hypothetical protein